MRDRVRRAMRAGASALGLIAAMILLAGCNEAAVDPPASGGPGGDPSGEISFQMQVLPLFRTNGCTGCHGGSSGLSVGTVHALMIGGDHGPAISPGNGEESILIKKLRASPPFGSRMPLGGPFLSDTAIGIVRRWINEGAKDN